MIGELVRELKSRRRWLLASHLSPDGDAVGSLVGLGLLLREAGKDVTLFNASGVPSIFRFLPGTESVVTELQGPLEFDGIIILDSGEAKRIGPLYERLNEFPLVVNLDHHPSREPWGDIGWVDVQASAVGEMIHTLAPLLPARITPEAAQNLYAAIMTDTGSFRYGNTTARCLAAATELVELGADPAAIAKAVYLTFSSGRLKLMAEALASLELSEDGRIGLLSLDRSALERTGTDSSDLDGFVDLARGIENVEVAAMFREEEGGYKISLRSNGLVDVARLANLFGGGGHRLAAGLFVPGSKDAVRTQVTKAIKQALNG